MGESGDALMTAPPVTPAECSKFEGCSAPLCPLDAEWQRRSYLKGEATCLYLRELVKGTNWANLGSPLPTLVAETIAASLAAMLAALGPHSRRLRRAARTGSKVDQGLRLARQSRTSVRTSPAGVEARP